MRLTTTLRPMLRLAASLLGKWRGAAEDEAASTPEPMPAGVHIVREGDSLVRIANLHGLSAYALMAANPQVTPSTEMLPGQRIAVPSMASGMAYCAQYRMDTAPVRSRGCDASPQRVGHFAAA